MIEAFQRASAWIFYVLGTCTILAIILVQRDILVSPLSLFLRIVDLPLIFIGLVFGGSAFVSSLSKGQPSTILITIVSVFLLLIFVALAYFNFALPFAA